MNKPATYTRNSDSRVFTIAREEDGKVVVKDELTGEELAMKPALFRARYTATASTYAATSEALAPYWTAIRDRIVASLTKHVADVYEQLKADNLDAEISFGYPSSNMSRVSYMLAKERYAFVRTWTTYAKPTRHPNEPDTRVLFGAEQLAAKIKTRAEKDATDVIRGYVHKLTAKEDGHRASGTPSAIVASATYTGDLWTRSFMRYTLTDGTVHTWKTNMILNVSCLGKLFNQFPTRLV